MTRALKKYDEGKRIADQIRDEKVQDISRQFSLQYSIVKNQRRPSYIRDEAYSKGVDTLNRLPNCPQRNSLLEMLDVARMNLSPEDTLVLKTNEFYDAYKTMTSPNTLPSQRQFIYDINIKKIARLPETKEKEIIFSLFTKDNNLLSRVKLDADMAYKLRKVTAQKAIEEEESYEQEFKPWLIPGIDHYPPEQRQKEHETTLAKWKEKRKEPPRKKYARFHKK